MHVPNPQVSLEVLFCSFIFDEACFGTPFELSSVARVCFSAVVQQFRLCEGQLDIHHCGAEAFLKRTGKSWSFYLEHRITGNPAVFVTHFLAYLGIFLILLRLTQREQSSSCRWEIWTVDSLQYLKWQAGQTLLVPTKDPNYS